MTEAVGILGFGYTAQFFAEIMSKQGYVVYGTSRNQEVRKKFTKPNVTILDFTAANVKAIIETCSNILLSIPPDADGQDPLFNQFKTILLNDNPSLNWVGYLSSTSVYGDHLGEWVTEETPPNQPGRAGIERLQAEKQWLSLYEKFQLPVHVFRLAGIYGPGRNNLSRILNGKDFTINKPGHFFSRIHVEDIGQALNASIDHPTPGEIYNICDDKPAPTNEVDQFAAKLLNRPLLIETTLEQANLSPMGLAFYQHNKRVSNKKVKDTFHLKWHYPTYQEGLKALLAFEKP